MERYFYLSSFFRGYFYFYLSTFLGGYFYLLSYFSGVLVTALTSIILVFKVYIM